MGKNGIKTDINGIGDEKNKNNCGKNKKIREGWEEKNKNFAWG